ncbi:MAG TPA: BTAD domain-containing putative transcriptional regulator [Candidatus Elarobacter sp.]|nr:BTAD domain-containing putative transcriptional regulator [Candidatus Elarobacter sp.]
MLAVVALLVATWGPTLAVAFLGHGTFGVLWNGNRHQGDRVEVVEPDSPAARAGVRVGDVLIGTTPAADAKVAHRWAFPGERVRLTLRRGTQSRTVLLTAQALSPERWGGPGSLGYRWLFVVQWVEALAFLALGTIIVLLRPSPSTWALFIALTVQADFGDMNTAWFWRLPAPFETLAFSLTFGLGKASIFALLIFALRFPDDRVAGVWRTVERGALGAAAIVGSAMIAVLLTGGFNSPGLLALNTMVNVLYVPAAITGLLALRWSALRAGAADRQRLRWVQASVAWWIVTYFVGAVVAIQFFPAGWAFTLHRAMDFAQLPLLAMLGYALARRHVVDVRFILNRAVVAATVVVAISSVFAAIAALGTRLLAPRTSQFFSDAVLVVIIALAALCYRSVDERLTRFLFTRLRTRSDAVAGVVLAIRNAGDLRTVAGVVQHEVHAALELTHAILDFSPNPPASRDEVRREVLIGGERRAVLRLSMHADGTAWDPTEYQLADELAQAVAATLTDIDHRRTERMRIASLTLDDASESMALRQYAVELLVAALASDERDALVAACGAPLVDADDAAAATGSEIGVPLDPSLFVSTPQGLVPHPMLAEVLRETHAAAIAQVTRRRATALLERDPLRAVDLALRANDAGLAVDALERAAANDASVGVASSGLRAMLDRFEDDALEDAPVARMIRRRGMALRRFELAEALAQSGDFEVGPIAATLREALIFRDRYATADELEPAYVDLARRVVRYPDAAFAIAAEASLRRALAGADASLDEGVEGPLPSAARALTLLRAACDVSGALSAARSALAAAPENALVGFSASAAMVALSDDLRAAPLMLASASRLGALACDDAQRTVTGEMPVGALRLFIEPLVEVRRAASPLIVELAASRLRNGHQIVGCGGKELALALRLGASADAVSAPALAADLWPEQDAEGGIRLLQSNVYRLRQRLPTPSLLEFTPSGYRWAGSVSVDLAADARALENLGDEPFDDSGVEELADARCEAIAARLLRPRAAAAEQWEWYAAVEQRIVDLGRRALLRAARGRLGRGDARGALNAARTAVAWDEFDDDARELEIRALVAVGRRGEALSAFRRYRDFLRDELQVEPSPQLRDLFRNEGGRVAST